MVTDRKIIISNGSTSVELTAAPYTVQETTGFDRLEIEHVKSQGFDQDGATLINSYVLPREMEITGQIKAYTTAQMQLLRDKLQSLFVPKKELTVTHYYGGINRVINAITEKSPKFDFTDVAPVQQYSVSLVATDPYWRDQTETLIAVANVIGGFHFPLVIPKSQGVTFGIKSSSLIAKVYNRSSIKVGMQITFIAGGVVKNPQLFDVNKRTFIKLLCTMGAGEKIVIQTGQDNTVTKVKNGVSEDYIGKIDLAGGGDTFLELNPGDNLFRYAADAGENYLETRIQFYNRYPGV